MKIGRYAIGPRQGSTPRDCPCTSAHAMGRKPEEPVSITGDAQGMVPHAGGPSPGAPKGNKVFGSTRSTMRRCMSGSIRCDSEPGEHRLPWNDQASAARPSYIPLSDQPFVPLLSSRGPRSCLPDKRRFRGHALWFQGGQNGHDDKRTTLTPCPRLRSCGRSRKSAS